MITDRGFREIAHTADWEMETWAPDLSGLIEQAVIGMQKLAGLVLDTGGGSIEIIKVEGDDPESLLVGFLAELLFIQESRNLGARILTIQISGDALTATVAFTRVIKIQKEIKAVTWHHLKVNTIKGGLKTRIVFDV
jgi:SHS2 domain-containing protein